ncbi:hypothetical protein DAI22_03g323900 [Oryza sativa Japonica Group]|nr:hypothetical protein DAI22_03g323900 [Oryza sativa Japonica Group]
MRLGAEADSVVPAAPWKIYRKLETTVQAWLSVDCCSTCVDKFEVSTLF